MKKRFLLLAFCICRYLTLFSQFSIHGTVKDETGSTMVGANVLIEQSYQGTKTNNKGEFILDGLKSGDYTINFSFLGYESVSKSITVNENTILDVNLNRKSFLSDEVIVRATRAPDNSPITKSVITREEIQDQNLGQDLPYLMALTPSLVTSSDAGAGVGYTNFRIRGTDLNRINITFNGIPVNDAESHGVWWVDMPDFASSVDNIQIQRGVGTSTLGGGAFGATINLQTLGLNKKPYVELTNSYGSFNTVKNSVSFGTGLIGNHFTLDGRLSRITSDGYIDRASSDLKSFYVSGSYYSGKSIIKLNISSGIEKTYQAWDGVLEDSLKTHRTFNDLGLYTDAQGKLQAYNNQTDNYQLTHFQLLFSHSFSPTLNFNAALHYSPGKGYYEEYKENQPVRKYSLIDPSQKDTTTNLVRRKWLDNAFYGVTWSLNYTKNSLNIILGGGANQYFGKHYGRVIWTQYNITDQPDHPYYYSDGTKNDVNFFAKSMYSLNDKLAVFGDLQYRYIRHTIKGMSDDPNDDGSNVDISQEHHYSFFNPKAGLTYKLDNNNSFYGYVGEAHREPTRDDLVDADVNNPAPKPERLIDFEIGYNLNTKSLQFGVNLYYMTYKDQLVMTGKINDVGTAIMTNAKKSYRAGIELVGAARFSEKFKWNANVTFSRNVIQNFTSYVPVFDSVNYTAIIRTDVENFKSTDISFSPNIIMGSQLSYAITKTITVNLLSKYVGKQYIDNTQNENQRLNPYFVNDLRINCRFKIKNITSIEPILMINNIFNTQYETNAWDYQYKVENGSQSYTDKAFYPQAGRNFMMGLVLKF